MYCQVTPILIEQDWPRVVVSQQTWPLYSPFSISGLLALCYGESGDVVRVCNTQVSSRSAY